MRTLKIDIVSDVVCPWCFIGYRRLEQALDALSGEITCELEWHPFELNPDMPPEGELIDEHIGRKYGLGPEQMRENRARLAEAGGPLGIVFYNGADRRIYNTFDAHRILHWAGEHGRRHEFGLALFEEYFIAGHNPSDPEVLARVAATLGLDAGEVRQVLATGHYAEAVRTAEREYMRAGVSAVPAFIVDRAYLISGAQEPATFVRALREIAASA